VAREGVRRRYRGLPVRHRDVNMQRVDDLEPREGPELLLHPPVALPRGKPLGEGVRERVQSGGSDPHPRLARGICYLAAQRAQLSRELRDGREDRRAHLDAVLEELGGHTLGALGSGAEHGLYGGSQLQGGRIDQLKFFLHAHGVRAAGTEAGLHAGHCSVQPGTTDG